MTASRTNLGFEPIGPSAGVEPSGPFQARVEPWMRECFGDVIPFDKVERGDRLLEETFELLQSGGYDPARVLALRDYVWARDVGEPTQELGGVMVTLAAYSLAFGMDMAMAGETELARIWTKVPQIRAKQAAKPTGSALPIAPASPSHAQPCPGKPHDPDDARDKVPGAWRPDVEAVARVIDPAALKTAEEHIAEITVFRASIPAREWETTPERQGRWKWAQWDQRRQAALTKARAILDLPSPLVES